MAALQFLTAYRAAQRAHQTPNSLKVNDKLKGLNRGIERKSFTKKCVTFRVKKTLGSKDGMFWTDNWE